MARKKIREYDSKRLVKEHFKRLSGKELPIRSVQINQETDLNELVELEPWLSFEKLVVKPDMLFGKRGKSGLVALNLDFAEVATFVKERLGKEVEMSGCKGPITTFIVEPFVPHNEEFYLNIVSDRLGCSISFSECGGIDIEENWDKVKTISIPTGASLTPEICAPLVATLPLEIKGELEDFIQVIFTLFEDLDFTFLEMNPFTLVDGKPYPLDMRGELDDTAAFKNFKKWGDIDFPMPFGRVMSPTESFIHGLDEKTSASLKFTVLNPKGRIWTMVAGGGASVIYADTVGDLGYASELGNYAEYSGAPKEDEVLQYARVVIDCATANPDGKTRALVIGGGIANFTDVAATFNGIIRALKEKEAKLKAARMHIFVRRGGPNYQKGLAKMRSLGDEIGIPIEVYGPEATMTGICKEAIQYITSRFFKSSSLSPMDSVTATYTTAPGHEKDETEFQKNQKRYQDLIATFPHVKGWRPKAPLINYGGHWFTQGLLEGTLHAQEFYQARPSDVLVCSYPKTGSTWLKALTFTILNRSRLQDPTNPLLQHNPHELVPFIEIEVARFPEANALKDKRNTLFSTHLPYELLPESVSKSGCKMVYIWRDPKDTLISRWTFFQKQKPDLGPVNSLEESFDKFCRGHSSYGPYLDHVLGYWKAYQANPEHILFLKYETMRADPIPYVKRLAEFMGCGFTDEEEEKGVVEKVVNLCSFETLKNLEVNEGEKKREDVPLVYYSNSAYFRKGRVGDWHNYLTPEMAARINGLMESKFKGSGLLEHDQLSG